MHTCTPSKGTYLLRNLTTFLGSVGAYLCAKFAWLGNARSGAVIQCITALPCSASPAVLPVLLIFSSIELT